MNLAPPPGHRKTLPSLALALATVNGRGGAKRRSHVLRKLRCGRPENTLRASRKWDSPCSYNLHPRSARVPAVVALVGHCSPHDRGGQAVVPLLGELAELSVELPHRDAFRVEHLVLDNLVTLIVSCFVLFCFVARFPSVNKHQKRGYRFWRGCGGRRKQRVLSVPNVWQRCRRKLVSSCVSRARLRLKPGLQNRLSSRSRKERSAGYGLPQQMLGVN